MELEARVQALRSLKLFSALPDARLRSLGERLQSVSVPSGQAFIVEGAASDGLNYVLSGRVRVAKRLGEGGEKDLAFLGPGECLGEMEILHSGTRSASAYAVGATELLKLGSADLDAWLQQDHQTAARVFAALSDIQSARLRRNSDEVALLYDLCQLLVGTNADPAALLTHALSRVTPHLQGAWAAEARAYNLFDDEMALVARRGAAFTADTPEPPPATAADASWTDERTLQLVLRAPKRLLGLLRFRADEVPDEARRAETERTLTTVARLLTSELENADFRNDEALRERLKKRSYGPSL